MSKTQSPCLGLSPRYHTVFNPRVSIFPPLWDVLLSWCFSLELLAPWKSFGVKEHPSVRICSMSSDVGRDVGVEVPSYVGGTQCLRYLCGDVTIITWKYWLHLSTAKLFYCFCSACSLDRPLSPAPFTYRKKRLHRTFFCEDLSLLCHSVHPPTYWDSVSRSEGWPWTCYTEGGSLKFKIFLSAGL